MQIAGVGAVVLAAVSALAGVWTLSRPCTGELRRQVLRAVAPTQLAAALMLAAGGAVALAGPPRIGWIALILGVLGAVATVAAGCRQGARYAVRRQALPATGCGGTAACTSCTLSPSRAERGA